MKKYLKYTIESLQIGGPQLFYTALKYFVTKRAPAKPFVIHNRAMGTYLCRGNTTDFMYPFLSYEYRIKSRIKALLPDFDTYIDVGACIGDYSIWLAKQGLKCFAFEPNSDNNNALRTNVQANRLEESIQVHNYGLGATSETVTFETNPTNRGYSGKYAQFEAPLKEEVEIKRFDDIYTALDLENSRGVIMKIDAEGMEGEVIDGARQFLSSVNKLFLIFEAHTGADATIRTLQEIAQCEIVDLDELNIGVIIDNTQVEESQRSDVLSVAC